MHARTHNVLHICRSRGEGFLPSLILSIDFRKHLTYPKSQNLTLKRHCQLLGQIQILPVVFHEFLLCAQVWGFLCAVRDSQMVFVCDGEQQRYSGGSCHRSALISLFHLQVLSSYKHPQFMGLWCFGLCVYSEKSGKYVNFTTKRTRANNRLSGRMLQLIIEKHYNCSITQMGVYLW